MKKAILYLFMMLGFISIDAQSGGVPKAVVVEHFTNTRCGICASRNPGFFANLENQVGVLHISIYPSAPYPSCLLHQHNPTESDARTQFYGVYGGTPRLVIQGASISAGSNYSSPSIFEAHLLQVSPISINVLQSKVGNELVINLEIKAEIDNNIGSAKLFIAAVEKLIDYNAPNGETEFANVFRRTLNGEATGELVDVPAIAGEILELSYTTVADAEWDFADIYAMAILQSAADNSLIQADASDPTDNVPLTSTQEANSLSFSLFPNPVQEQLTLEMTKLQETNIFLYNAQGALIKTQQFNGHTSITMDKLPAGIYWLHIKTENGTAIRKIVKR